MTRFDQSSSIEFDWQWLCVPGCVVLQLGSWQADQASQLRGRRRLRLTKFDRGCDRVVHGWFDRERWVVACCSGCGFWLGYCNTAVNDDSSLRSPCHMCTPPQRRAPSTVRCCSSAPPLSVPAAALAEGADALVWPLHPGARVQRRTIEPLRLQPEKPAACQ